MVKQQQTILLVEDEAIIAMLEAKQLERRGYHVVHALSGERAIEIVNEDLDSVDLILMDINLGSGMDGTEAAAIILKEHDIPVVFLSSHTEEEIVEKTENISSYGYVAKNSGETVLVASIKMAFKLHQARTTLIEKDRALQQKTEELDAFFAYARDLLCITDTEGNFIHLSKEWENVIGYPLEELEGENCLRFLHADDVKPTIEKLSQLSKQLPVIGYVNRYRRKDGSYRWIEWNSFPSGKRVYAAARDITERKFMEKRMLAWQNLMQYVIQYAPTAIAVHDKNLNYIFVSDRYLVEYGIKDRDIIGKHHYEVFPDLPEKWRAVHQRVLRGAIEHAENDPYIRSDGSVEITNWECRPWYDEEGEIGGLIVYTAVVTRQKNVEESLLLNNKRLQSIVDTLQYPARNMQDFLDHALEEAIQITASTIGYIYFYDDEKRLFALNTWSDDVMKECSITNPQTLYELDKTGIWGEAVRQRKPIVLNDFQADHPLKRGYPEGHVKLHRFLTIPVMIGERIVAVVGVANK
ncbi:MAG TPA: PAS domain S-box protein, partial [Spirochaetia bacterium]|nr:PAS domain S-box protein [Spirochaetia bacterium]